jgi:hypothetical protein
VWIFVILRDYSSRVTTGQLFVQGLKGGYFFEQNQDNTHINLLFDQQILMSEFSHRTALNKGGTFRNDYPNVWANDFITLHEKKRRAAPAEVTPAKADQPFLKRAAKWMRSSLS